MRGGATALSMGSRCAGILGLHTYGSSGRIWILEFVFVSSRTARRPGERSPQTNDAPRIDGVVAGSGVEYGACCELG